ncbi:MAG: PD-(D/E)XK nuclease family protein [Patescibacteria group bacterium]|nr:PD-(D/E)XK nuclease family protein [Patescibacteria group bacterium]
MNTSFSALNTFKTCPLKYKFQVIDKIKTPKSPEAVFGTLVHSTMKFIHTGDFVFPTIKEALNYFSSNWNSEIFEDEIRERVAFAQGIRMVQEYYKKNDPNQTKIVSIESRFTIEIENKKKKENHLVSGFIDRIDKTEEGFEIIDYKTSKKLPPQSTIDENLQLLIYLLAFLKRYPKETDLSKIKLSLFFLHHGIRLSTIKTSAQLEEGVNEVLETIETIESSDFPATVGPLCDWCGYQNICPMWKHKFKQDKENISIDQKKTIKQFVELIEKMKEDRKKVAQLKQQLIQLMEQEGVERLFSDSKIIAKTSRKTYAFDEDKVKNILQRNDLWDKVVKLNQVQLKKVMETLDSSTKKEIEKTRELARESWGLSIKKK